MQTGGPREGVSCIFAGFVSGFNVSCGRFMMGSGGMIVMDDRSCMVDVAKYFIDFLVENLVVNAPLSRS